MRGRLETAVGTQASSGSRSRACRVGFRRLAVRGVFALAALGPPSARATNQSTSTSSTSSLTPIVSPNGDIRLIPNSQGIERLADYHSQNRPWWISYKDCADVDGNGNGDVFTFTLSHNSPGSNLEVWAGTENCANGRRDVSTIGQCWMVGQQTLQNDSAEVDVPVRSVVARRTEAGAVLPGPLGPDVCDNSTEANGESISFYFIVVKGGLGDEYLTWNGTPGGTGIDVIGPSPPGRINVGVGESQLAISLGSIPEDSTRERYEAFCVPEGTLLESAESGEDAGVSGGDVLFEAALQDAGLDAGGGGTGGTGSAGPVTTCGSNVLQVGQRPPTQPEYSCGTTNAISDTLRTKRLLNETTYAVAVSGQDDLGNAGVISEIECGRPIPLDDFWELASRAGGAGGGGFCSFSPGRRAAGAGSAGVALLVLTLVGLGRRRARGRG
jgi:hypothetical protein